MHWLHGETVTWSYNLNHGPRVNFMQSDLDSKGRAGMQWVVGRDPRTPWLSPGDHFEIYVDRGYEVIPRAVHVDVVSPDDVKIKMWRVSMGSDMPLPEGGAVLNTFIGNRDLAVGITIDNQPSFFLSAFSLVQKSDGGQLLIDPDPKFKDTGNSVIFPKEMKTGYLFNLAEKAHDGVFRIVLADPYGAAVIDETTAHVANDYFEFTCNRESTSEHSAGQTGRCSGTLELKLGDGSVVWPISAKSGSNGSVAAGTIIDGKSLYPALPAYEYRIDNIDLGPRRQLRRISWIPVRRYCMYNSAMGQWNDEACKFNDDFGNGWFAHLTPDPVDQNSSSKNGKREGLGIHPSRGSGYTNGCIGLDQTVNTRPLTGFIDDYIKEMGPILRVKVNP